MSDTFATKLMNRVRPDESVRRLVSHVDVARHARDVWEQMGRPENRDVEIWLRAEREVRRERQHAEAVKHGTR